MSASAVDPLYCSCFAMTDNDGMIIPTLCRAHEDELQRKLGGTRYSVPRYARYFATMEDATDRAKIIYQMKPTEGYGTSVTIIPISRWFYLRAYFAESCE